MKVGQLIRTLTLFPMDSEVVIDSDDPVMTTVDTGNKTIRLEGKSQMDLQAELEARIEFYIADNWDEVDAVRDMLEAGYRIEDFKYNTARYEWSKKIAEENGLI